MLKGFIIIKLMPKKQIVATHKSYTIKFYEKATQKKKTPRN